jgi:uncharacterized protein YggE
MNSRIRSLVIAAVLGTAFLSGCTHQGSQRPIVISNETTGIAVQGHGEVSAAPDVAVISIGVEVRATSVAEAREGAAQSANRLMASLQNGGVAKDDIQTTGLNIQPQYDYPPNGKPIITGYVVSNDVTVKIRRIDNASRIIDDAVKAGGDDVRLNGIHFEIDDPTKLREAAREKAVKEALAKAKQLASLSGVDLGTPISVEEVGFSAPGVPMAPAAMLERDAATPVSPGQTKVSVDVRVRWSIDS